MSNLRWLNRRVRRLMTWALRYPSPALGFRVPTFREAWTGIIGDPPPRARPAYTAAEVYAPGCWFTGVDRVCELGQKGCSRPHPQRGRA